MKNIAVFCASSKGNDKIYEKEAEKLGTLLAKKDIRLIYGGASVGLMNAVADAVLKNGGKVTGIIPDFLDKLEITKKECTETIFTATMFERKIKMLDISDGIIVLPGGFGTLDELFEALTLVQLKVLNIPVGLLNINGFYNPLIEMLDSMVEKGFLKKENRAELIEAPTIEELLKKMIKTK